VNVLVLRQAIAVRSVPLHMVAITLVAAGVAGAIAALEGWPLWAIGVCAVAPFLPLLVLETRWLSIHYGWFALFWALVVLQSGHLGEHVAQMTQLHLLGEPAKEAHGIFGQLDIEWVHFVWNGLVVTTAIWLLLIRFWRNPWLWAAAVAATWHMVEHVVIFRAYLRTGVPGDLGLLAHGGRIGGGLPLSRADLHFLYNALETLPLWIAFVWQVKRVFGPEGPAEAPAGQIAAAI
jgi:hypothetical protein